MRSLLIAWALAFTGCASAPAPSASSGSTKSPAELAASQAVKMVGKPYKYGGSSPSGFDCSGLVLYSYKQAGVALPHSTDKQRSTSRLVKVSELRRGDLLFFNQEGKKIRRTSRSTPATASSCTRPRRANRCAPTASTTRTGRSTSPRRAARSN